MTTKIKRQTSLTIEKGIEYPIIYRFEVYETFGTILLKSIEKYPRIGFRPLIFGIWATIVYSTECTVSLDYQRSDNPRTSEFPTRSRFTGSTLIDLSSKNSTQDTLGSPPRKSNNSRALKFQARLAFQFSSICHHRRSAIDEFLFPPAQKPRNPVKPNNHLLKNHGENTDSSNVHLQN